MIHEALQDDEMMRSPSSYSPFSLQREEWNQRDASTLNPIRGCLTCLSSLLWCFISKFAKDGGHSPFSSHVKERMEKRDKKDGGIQLGREERKKQADSERGKNRTVQRKNRTVERGRRDIEHHTEKLIEGTRNDSLAVSQTREKKKNTP